MAIDFSVMSVVAYCLPDAKHNKKDFDKDLSGTNNLFTNMCAVVDSLKVMCYNYNKAMDANRYNNPSYKRSVFIA